MNQRVPKDHSSASSQHVETSSRMCKRQPGIGQQPSLSHHAAHFFNTHSGPLSQPSVDCTGNATGNGTCTAQSSNPWSSLLPILTSTNPSPVCNSYVRPEILVRICDECNFGTYGVRCTTRGPPGPFSRPFTQVELELIGPNNRYLRCVLLCRMYTAGEGQRRLSQDRQPRCESNGPLL